MFIRLRKEIVPQLQPYLMDRFALEQYRKAAMRITSPSYLKTLEKLEKDPEYACFHEVIGKMLEEKIRLEQEAMIVFEPQGKWRTKS